MVYNRETKKYDWHTVHGKKENAKTLKRKFQNAKANCEYVGPLERKTFEAVSKLFLDDKRAKNRRFSTLEEYETELKLRLLPQAADELPCWDRAISAISAAAT